MTRRGRSLFRLSLGCLSLLVAFSAAAQPPKRAGKVPARPAGPPESERIDVDAAGVRATLVFLGDGAGHFLALGPFGDGEHVYYGDGARFFQQRIGSRSSSGNESWSYTFWEPRVGARYQAGIDFRDATTTVQCGERKTVFAELSEEEAGVMRVQASFYQPLWKFRAYALARDDRGTYYYVDRQREPRDSLVFRVFRGPRGRLAALKMKNVVSDSGGEIFATVSGELRLVLDRKESSWVKGKQRITLTSLPIEDNAVMIYRDLGAYTGQRLGTPCDDLL